MEISYLPGLDIRPGYELTRVDGVRRGGLRQVKKLEPLKPVCCNINTILKSSHPIRQPKQVQPESSEEKNFGRTPFAEILIPNKVIYRHGQVRVVHDVMTNRVSCENTSGLSTVGVDETGSP